MSKFDEAFKHLLALEPNEIRLKWVFDHVRNYALAATVMIAGFYLFKHGAVVSPWPGAGYVFGTLLLLSGFILLVLNMVQPIWAMAKHKIRMLPYMIVSLIILLGASEFFWVIFKRSQV